MTNPARRPDRRRIPWLVVAIAVPLLALIALLAFGLRAAHPNHRIDDALSQARFVAPPPFSLPVLADGAVRSPLAGPWRRARSDQYVSLRELRGHPPGGELLGVVV